MYNTLHAPTSLSKTEDIKSWDTEKYLKTLSKFNNDNIFNDQISKITEKQYDFDKTATNENYYNLNLYDIYFQPCSNIIEENITRILQFQYSNSPTFRRLVNYHTDNLPNYDINKCQIYITNTFAYNKKEDSVSELFIALDEKGNFIVPKTESLEEISPEKILLNFFLKHISNPDILGYDDIDTYTNIIFKELSPQAIAHTSKSFQHASVRDKYKLYDCENSTKQIDNIEQVISKGSTLQKEFFDSYIKNKELDPIPSQKKGIQFKKIALNGLLLTSGLFQTLNNNQHSGNSNSLDKINVRHSRSLPEEHSAPAETKSSSIVKGINEFILKKAASLYNLLTNLELELQLENYIRGYHELLAFSQTGIWTRNGRDAARNYIVEIMKQHFYKFEIEYNSGRVVFFQDFIEKHREYEYNIYETFARDIIVHPLPFDLDYAPPEKGGIIRSEPANHYMQTVRQKFSHSAPLHFDNLYGKESIFLSVALHDLKSNKKLSKRDFEHLFKIAQLVIHHLSKDGGDKILCSSYGVKYHRLILNEIVTRCKHHQRHINESIIEKISLAIITNNDLSNQIKSKILKLNSQKKLLQPMVNDISNRKTALMSGGSL